MAMHKMWKRRMEAVVQEYPEDAESRALLGRVENSIRINAWRPEDQAPEDMREDAACEDSLLRESIDGDIRGLQPEPRLVFLFSGHMIDAPDREAPRFPADQETTAAAAIAAKLDALGAGAEDLALCGGACGGDLLFAEACLERGLRLQIRIPFEEPRFLRESVSFAGQGWRNRFFQTKAHPNTSLFIMLDELGATPKDVNPFVRNNLWQLYTALAWEPENVRFICLWNRQEGDGPGGTQHMHDTVLHHSGQVFVLDTNTLW